MKAYKVVKPAEDGDYFVSAWAPEESRATYRVWQPAKAPQKLANLGFHLWVYTDRALAVEHCHGYGPFSQVWECEAEGIHEIPPQLISWGDLLRGRYQAYQAYAITMNRSSIRMAESVTLLERVK